MCDTRLLKCCTEDYKKKLSSYEPDLLSESQSPCSVHTASLDECAMAIIFLSCRRLVYDYPGFGIW